MIRLTTARKPNSSNIAQKDWTRRCLRGEMHSCAFSECFGNLLQVSISRSLGLLTRTSKNFLVSTPPYNTSDISRYTFRSYTSAISAPILCNTTSEFREKSRRGYVHYFIHVPFGRVYSIAACERHVLKHAGCTCAKRDKRVADEPAVRVSFHRAMLHHPQAILAPRELCTTPLV